MVIWDFNSKREEVLIVSEGTALSEEESSRGSQVRGCIKEWEERWALWVGYQMWRVRGEQRRLKAVYCMLATKYISIPAISSWKCSCSVLFLLGRRKQGLDVYRRKEECRSVPALGGKVCDCLLFWELFREGMVKPLHLCLLMEHKHPLGRMLRWNGGGRGVIIQ